MAITTDAEFAAVYRAHYQALLRFVRRRAHPINVDDIVAETFLAAWRRRSELPVDPRPWLFRTARNAMLNAHRGAERHSALAVRIAEQRTVDTFDDTARVDVRLDWTRAWRQLAPADQEVLALHVWEELDGRAAALVLGCSRATYSMRLSRAKKRLAAVLVNPVAPQHVHVARNH
jgi:RNA polymerase sigma-70 factor (ECF subfamily)